MVAIFQTRRHLKILSREWKCLNFPKMFEFSLISLKCVLKVLPINNIPALVKIMAWNWTGDNTLSEPIIISLLTHICVTRPQWVNIGLNYLILTPMISYATTSKKGQQEGMYILPNILCYGSKWLKITPCISSDQWYKEIGTGVVAWKTRTILQ